MLLGCQSRRAAITYTPTYFVYRSAGVGVFFSPCFHYDWTTKLANACDNAAYLNSIRFGLGALLADGRVTGAQMYKTIEAIPGKPPGIVNVSKDDPPLLTALEAYPEPLLKVIDVEEEITDNGHTIALSLYLTPHREETGWGEVHQLRIVAKNPNVDVRQQREAFFRNAVVAEVRSLGILI